MNERIIALDIGDARIGVAVSDASRLIATPIDTIYRVGYGPDVRKVVEICQRYDTTQVLSGWPLNMDGTEGPRAEKCAAFGELLRQETPKALTNVTTRITGSVRELCTAAAAACRALGYEPVLLTDRLCCEAREAGSFLGSIVRTHAGQGKKLAYIAGGETIVHLTGKGLGGRNQELALAAAPAIAGLNAAVFSVGSDGTDGPTDAAGGYVDGDTLAALEAGGWSGYAALQNNDSYHALKAVDGLIITGATGTNVNDVAVALIGEKTLPVSPEVSPEW